MRIIEAQDVHRVMNFAELVEALRGSFGGPAGTPQRSVFRLDPDASHGDAFAVLPAWNEKAIGVKAFTYFPSNPAKGFDTLYSKILLFDRENGVPQALVDGTSVTYWRTAAVSALGADYLAKPDAKRLLVCGTGKLAPYMALAHATVRAFERIEIWGRSADKAQAVVEQLKAARPELEVVAVEDLEAAVREADVVSCATGSHDPIVFGSWVGAGTHVDLVGNHERNGRECDTEMITKARVYVDSRINVLNEAGELLLPIEEGVWNKELVQAELSELCSGRAKGRLGDEVTVFKTVGSALSDLTGAHLVMQKIAAQKDGAEA